jgi:hypothetical protein
MGAGITTFVDTMFAALLLGNPAAVAVVLAQMLSVALVSALFLTLRFSAFERLTLSIASWASSDTRNLTISVLTIVSIPLLLLLL